jgi:hypothetical protein
MFMIAPAYDNFAADGISAGAHFRPDRIDHPKDST